jgi:predicted nucleotide-binding protein
MKKAKEYSDVLFDSKTISDAERALRSLIPDNTKLHPSIMTVEMDDARWSFNTFEEFLAATDRGSSLIYIASENSKLVLSVTKYEKQGYTQVDITAPSREEIESLSSIFENNKERCRIASEPAQGKIFIGHGRDKQWRDLKDHLQDKHDYQIVAYEIGSRTGHGIKSVLEEMLEESSVALLVMTGEDRTKQGTLRARQNVVHEAGLFQGKLGFTRVAILREHGTEEFSNLDGIQEIRFPKGKIRETFGDVLAFLSRELG